MDRLFFFWVRGQWICLSLSCSVSLLRATDETAQWCLSPGLKAYRRSDPHTTWWTCIWTRQHTATSTACPGLFSGLLLVRVLGSSRTEQKRLEQGTRIEWSTGQHQLSVSQKSYQGNWEHRVHPGGKREAMVHCSFIGKFKSLSQVHQGCCNQ